MNQAAQRLQKWLSGAGYCSRRAAEELIAAGRVTVNGAVAPLGQTVLGTEDIRVDGEKIEPKKDQQTRVVLYHKPVGVESTFAASTKETPTLAGAGFDEKLVPIGRLDRASRGLLLLTTNGELALRLTHPRYEHEKVYEVRLHTDPSPEQLQHMRRGVELKEGIAQVVAVEPLAKNRIRITLAEGKNRQIRRMCGIVGLEVLDLLRTEHGGLPLGTLKPGAYRDATPEELSALAARVELPL